MKFIACPGEVDLGTLQCSESWQTYEGSLMVVSSDQPEPGDLVLAFGAGFAVFLVPFSLVVMVKLLRSSLSKS